MPPFDPSAPMQEHDFKRQIHKLVDWLATTLVRVRTEHPEQESLFWLKFGMVIALWNDVPFMQSTSGAQQALQQFLQTRAFALTNEPIPIQRSSASWTEDLDLRFHLQIKIDVLSLATNIPWRISMAEFDRRDAIIRHLERCTEFGRHGNLGPCLCRVTLSTHIVGSCCCLS
ncbi:hypothetical protein DFP72DRAFT_115310 [Ephemerocybe angulata]|uniref:Uncharacterized protein n=1 Tax=Ephemerocybe angulata TaxID=980116 RepID=A0A8H6MC48_9AGAR|nr:hypothetical protein DFP72DRAFT_115310 [Tulosesus angulatus]